MAGQKRSRSGEPKPQSKPQNPPSQPPTSTPPCGQAQPPSSKSTNSKSAKGKDAPAKKPRTKATAKNTYVPHIHGPLKQHQTKPHTATPQRPSRTKRPQLPENAIISKRPLLHPAIPTPFASAESPKVLYITASSPFIPTCKRIRSLLVQISKRSAQSSAENRGRGGRGKAKALEANGRLEAKDVEASIADAAAAAQGKGKGKGKNVGGEEVYLKATGRAIPRALELGVKFQGEEDCRVRVEMGNVKAIDDVDIKEGVNGEEVGEDVPETRIRTLSTVTVCIGLE